MIIRLKYLILIATLIFSLQLFAQHLITSSRTISVEDGLASHQVICGLQDKQGFIWFGTRNGLNRFDGENFLLFNKDKDSLQNDEILQLATDCNNLLFILYGDRSADYTSFGKVDIFDLKTYRVTSISKLFPQLPFKEQDIVSIGNDAIGNVFFITKNPDILWLYDSKSGFRKKLDLNIWKEPQSINRFIDAYINNGDIMLTKAYGECDCFIHKENILKIKADNSTIATPLFLYNKNQLNVIDINPPLEFGIDKVDDSGNVIPDDSDKIDLTKITRGAGTVWEFSTTDPFFVIKAPLGLWFCTPHDTSKFSNATDITDYNSLRFYQLFSDKQGNQWLCTSNGIIEMRMKQNRFTRYFTKAQQNDEINPQVRGIYEDTKGTIYANMWTNFFAFSNGHYSDTNLQFIYALGTFNDSICIGGNCLWEYNPKNHRYSRITHDNSFVWSLFPLSKDTLLLGRANGINLLEWSEKKLSEARNSNTSIPKPGCVYRFIKASDGKIWAAADNGLFVLDKSGNVTDYYGNSGEAKHKLPFPGAYDICEDSAGIFWLTTNGEGLYRWDKNRNEFRQFTFADGLPANVTYRIEKDNYGNLWISTDYGLTRLDLKTYSMINYDMTDGLSQNEFNRESSFKAADGKLFFGGINGVNAFDPKDFLVDSATGNSPLQIIGFSKFSGSQNNLLDLTKEITNTGEITLNPGDKFFNLQFILLDFETGKKHYAYKIDGIDKEWNNINENSIRISGLPYGEFTLRIKGRTAAGAWSRSELVIPMLVYTPYYRKAWFIILCILALIAIIYFIIYYRTRRLETEKTRLEDIVSERTSDLKLSLEKQQGLLKEKNMLLKEIHHRVKNNLQVISNLLEMQNVGIDDERAKSVIKEGQNRVRSIALIHQKLYQNEDIATIDLNEFTNELFSQVMGLFRKPGMTIMKEFNIGTVLLDIDTAVPLGLILNELFTNSFKYAFSGDAGGIGVSIETHGGGNYSLIYKDSGKGLPHGLDMNKAKSVGLWLVVSLSRQLGGDAQYMYDNGSKFTIAFKDTGARKDID